eukprot:1146700-Pelagomonas_calceolata.AAC.2
MHALTVGIVVGCTHCHAPVVSTTVLPPWGTQGIIGPVLHNIVAHLQDQRRHSLQCGGAHRRLQPLRSRNTRA